MSPTRAWADKMLGLELERLQAPVKTHVRLAPITDEQAAHNTEVLLAGLSDDPIQRAWADRLSEALRHA